MENFGIDSMAFIYCHTNKINGKKYVGQTAHNLNKRWQNGKGYKRSTYFYKAIEKYGWNNFNHKILCIVPESFADTMEKYFIKYYNTTDRDFGYNLEDGGNKEKHLNKYTKQKISKILKVVCNTPKWKNHVSECRKKYVYKHPEWIKEMNKTHDAEWRTRISESQKGKHLALETRTKISKSLNGNHRHPQKSIICVETGVVFVSISEAARELNLNKTRICYCCHHKPRYCSTGGLHFEFYNIKEAN